MINFLKLYNGHLRSSKRVLFIASIGLICALTIVSSTNYYFDTSKQLLVQNFIESNGNSYQPDVGFSMTAPLKTYNDSVSTVISDVNATQKAFSINFFKSIVVNPSILGLQIPNNITINGDTANQKQTNVSVRVVQLDNKYMQELNQLNLKNALITNSTLPTANNPSTDVYALFVNNNQMVQSVTNNITLQKDKSTVLYDPVNNSQIGVKVTGASTLDNTQFICPINVPCHKNPAYDNSYPILKTLANSFNDYGLQIYIFTPNLQKFVSLVNTAENTSPATTGSNNFYYNPTSIQITIAIRLDYSKIDPYASSSITSKINLFSQSLNDKLNNDNNLRNIFYHFYSQFYFDNLSSQITSLIFMLFLVSLPVLLATIFVINYSFGLIHKNVLQHIGVFKTRGATAWMLFDFQLLDNLLIMIASILVALVTGIPLSSLVIKTNYLLSFNNPAPAYLILNYTAVATLLFYTAVIMILIVNFRRLKRLSQMSIVETENPTEKDEPYWKKHFLDVILFGFGLIMYGVFYELVHNPNIAQHLGPIIIILSILVIPAPFALIIGLILVVNRFVPIVLNKIGTTLWARTGNLLAFSFKNVIRHRQASTRAVMLISILLAFMVLFYSLPYSMVVNNETNLYYRNGAEGSAEFTMGYNATTMKIIETNFSQYVTVSPYIIMQTTGSLTLDLMLVNISTYYQSAYLNFALGVTHNLRKDISNLKINASDFNHLNILMDKNSVQERRASVGSNITLSNNQGSVPVHIVDSFKNWPVIDSRFQYVSTAIGDISYYTDYLNYSLDNSPFTTIQQSGVLFNFKPGVNQSLVASWIEGNTSLSNIALESVAQKDFTNGIIFRLEVGQINNDVLMVVLISIVVLIMFAYLQLNERKKEIFTERAIGMKLHQIASLFFIETIILSLTSVVLGIGVGAFLMELLAILVFTPLQSYPPFAIIFPTNLIAVTAFAIMICSIIVSTIPAMFVTKQDISKSFGEA